MNRTLRSALPAAALVPCRRIDSLGGGRHNLVGIGAPEHDDDACEVTLDG